MTASSPWPLSGGRRRWRNWLVGFAAAAAAAAAGARRRGDRQLEQEDVVDGGAARERVGGLGQSVLGEEAFKQRAGADAGLLRQRDLALDAVMEPSASLARSKGMVSVEESAGAAMGVASWRRRGGPAHACVRRRGKSHQEMPASEHGEEDLLVAGDHWVPLARAAVAGGWAWLRQKMRAPAMAASTRCGSAALVTGIGVESPRWRAARARWRRRAHEVAEWAERGAAGASGTWERFMAAPIWSARRWLWYR